MKKRTKGAKTGNKSKSFEEKKSRKLSFFKSVSLIVEIENSKCKKKAEKLIFLFLFSLNKNIKCARYIKKNHHADNTCCPVRNRIKI